MDARRYFRYDWEPEGLGPGSIWTEFVDEEPTRQVEPLPEPVVLLSR